MVDNFEKIRSLLRFDNPGDDFYYIQVIKRRKENPSMSKNSRDIRSYYISSLEHYDSLISELKELAELFNARVYINVNPRSFKNIANYVAREVSNYLLNENYRSIPNVYNSCCGRYGKVGNKRKYYIVDIDFNCSDGFIREVMNDLNNKYLPKDTNKVKLINKTVNGYHILVSQFDVNSFMRDYSHMNIGSDKKKIDVLKNQNTLLYYKN